MAYQIYHRDASKKFRAFFAVPGSSKSSAAHPRLALDEVVTAAVVKKRCESDNAFQRQQLLQNNAEPYRGVIGAASSLPPSTLSLVQAPGIPVQKIQAAIEEARRQSDAKFLSREDIIAEGKRGPTRAETDQGYPLSHSPSASASFWPHGVFASLPTGTGVPRSLSRGGGTRDSDFLQGKSSFSGVWTSVPFLCHC